MEEFEWLSFSFTSLESVSWFPWLNTKVPSWRSLYSDKDGRRATVKLLIVMVPLWLSLKTLAFLFNATRKLFGISRDFNQTLDATAGDVVNYVRSRRPVEPTSSAAASICSQFSRVLQLASEQCDEIHILAHSLGTVVAHDALTGGTRDSVTEAPDDTGRERPFQKLHRLYTFGSPLEKILFFWPRLVKRVAEEKAAVSEPVLVPAEASRVTGGLPPSFEWHNFYHKCDPVSDRLSHFDHLGKLTNYCVKNYAGVFTSHTNYYSAPTVHSLLGEELLNLSPTSIGRFTHLKRRALIVLENLAVAAILIFIFLLGALAFFVGVPMVICMSWDWDLTFQNTIKASIPWLAFWIAFVIWYLSCGWRSVKSLHAKYIGDGT
jgi:hypothetical protein